MKGPEGTLTPQHGLARGKLFWLESEQTRMWVYPWLGRYPGKFACQDNCKTLKGFVYGSRRGACDEGLYTYLAHAIDNTRNMDG